MGAFLPPGYWSVERHAVAKAYPGKNWRDQVARMPKEQVHEIYLSLQKQKENKDGHSRTARWGK